MSASDSDFSIDWLASDEDDEDGPKKSSARRVEESPLPPPPPPPPLPSSSSSLRESPTSSFHSQRRRKKRRRSDPLDGGRCGVDADSAAAPLPSAIAPLQGFTSASSRLSAVAKRHSSGKRSGREQTPPDTEKELFSQKRAELQRYVRPLSSILLGLRSGRYSERLSSFQESVAVDRIQRLMGVLQNPHMSGRFLSIIPTIEAMLQSWFPHIRPDPTKKQKHHGASSPPPSSAASLCSPVCVLKTPGRPAASARRTQDVAQDVTQDVAQDVTQDSTVSSSTDSGPPLRRLGFKIRSPCLERLLQAKESVIAPRTCRELIQGQILVRPDLTSIEETTRP